MTRFSIIWGVWHLGGRSVWASLTGIPIADRHRSPVRRFIAGVAVLPATYFTVPASHQGCLFLATATSCESFLVAQRFTVHGEPCSVEQGARDVSQGGDGQ